MIMAPRAYSNYSNQELMLLRQESEAKGISISAYQKYCTLLSLNLKKDNKADIAALISKMKSHLSRKKPGDLFIVSSLLDDVEWNSLVRGEKITLAKTLKKIVEENPHKYSVYSVLPGKINQYIVLEEA